MKVADFSFDLPPDLVAQFPPAERGASRLLVVDRASGTCTHATIGDLPQFLRAGDLLVFNNTRVFPARLLGTREPGGGAVEVLLVSRLDDERWEALVHPGQRLKPGRRLRFERGGRVLHAEVLAQRFFGRREVRLWTDEPYPVMDVIESIGHIPLPPYIKRADLDLDRDRYQTVFARERGSIAAPTAGLHFTGPLLAHLDAAGIERAEITLHVGYGTFKPVRVDEVEAHTVDAEHYEIGPDAAARITAALDAGRRLVVVGTTTTRAVETAVARGDGRVEAGAGETDLFIYPGYQFRAVGALVTNFHLPSSSLLMLVAAFGGRETVLAAYAEAVGERYRFYSYGDAMLIV
ncbi:MAG: tRNA preQ1(34) S-adenosylmethionine ribosyltransferase-isomerase QueA [Acidobacteria bacterium]|nr:tRNA preQ1(34) S-adenosylmethionine ribosyltransferase-isomerase QueA [Acidobacteriota bacterium]